MFHSVGVEIGLGFSFSALILWGLWSVSYKLCSQRFGIRFELFFVNWVLGGLLQATLLAVLFGNNFIVVGGEDQQQFFSNLFHTSVMPVALCSIAGILAVMGNYLLLASTELTGLSVAFPVALSCAVVGGTTVTYIQDPKGNLSMIVLGVVLAVVAKICSAISFHFRPSAPAFLLRWLSRSPAPIGADADVSATSDRVEDIEEGREDSAKSVDQGKVVSPNQESSQTANKTTTTLDMIDAVITISESGSGGSADGDDGKTIEKGTSPEIAAANATTVAAALSSGFTGNKRIGVGLAYALCAGICFSVWPLFIDLANTYEQETENGTFVHLTNYTSFFLMLLSGAIFVLIHTCLTILFLPSFTLSKIRWADYHDSSKAMWHPIALVGGMVWASGAWCNFIASESVGFTISYFLAQASVLITATIGWMFFHEYDGSSVFSKIFLVLFYVVYIAAVVCISLAAVI